MSEQPLQTGRCARTILHVSTRLILGGSQENTVLSCEAQAEQGCEVHLAFGPISGPEGSMLDRVESFRTTDNRRIHTHVIPSMVRELSPIKDVRARSELKALIDTLKPDIVHTHSSKAGVLGRLAAWSSTPRPAVVHTIHGPPFMPDAGPVTALQNTIYERAEKHAAKRCHAIVSVADAMTERFLARGIGTRELYTTVRSGIELGPYQEPEPDQTRAATRKQLGLHEDHFVIGTVARLAQHKGHDDILDAIGEALISNPNWRLLGVGDGYWKERLLRRIRESGMKDRLITTGLVLPDQVPGLIRAMDLLVHPSYREGLPRTVNQALLCNVCPIAYDADGTREIVIDGETGALIPVGDTAALARAITTLAANPGRRQALADQGRSRIERDFSVAVMMRELDAVYENALRTRAI